MVKGRLLAQASRARTVADAEATAMTKDDTANNNFAAIFRVESLLACFAGIDVVIFVASQLLITPELFAQFQATFSTTVLMISSSSNSSTDGAVLELSLPSSTIPFDAIATPIERVGLVFLLLGMVRIHGSINHKDKGAAEVTLWSWIIELAFLLRQYTRLDAVIEDRLQQQQRQHQYDLVDGVASLAWCAQVAVVASMILVVLMLTWSYREYRRAFGSSCKYEAITTTTVGHVRRSSSATVLPPPPPLAPVCSPTTRLLRHVGWMASFAQPSPKR